LKTVIFFLLIIFLFYRLLQLYLSRNWVLFYTAFGHDNYFKIITKLNNAGVKYRTKTPVSTRGNDLRFMDQTQYDIFVKKDEEPYVFF